MTRTIRDQTHHRDRRPRRDHGNQARIATDASTRTWTRHQHRFACRRLPCPGLSTYCGAKHAVLGFTDSVRKEVRGTGVHISSVLPTLTNTQLTSGTSGMKGFREVQPEEIAEAIVGLITKPRPRVRITRVSGLLVQAQGFFPRRPYEALSRLFGVEPVSRRRQHRGTCCLRRTRPRKLIRSARWPASRAASHPVRQRGARSCRWDR